MAMTGAFEAVTIRDGSLISTYGSSSHGHDSVLRTTWNEAQSILVDANQKLGSHIDFMASIGSAILSESHYNHDPVTHSAAISRSDFDAYQTFVRQHADLVTSNRFCRMESPYESRNTIPTEHLESHEICQALGRFLANLETRDYISACAVRAAAHQRR